MSIGTRAFRHLTCLSRTQATVLVAVLVAAAGLLGSDRDSYPHISLPPGVSTQAASLVYGQSGGAEAYAAPGGLVVAGRDNFDDAAFREVDARGGSVLLYLDPIIDASWGRYHQLLLKDSSCGPAVPRWPGSPRANSWGHLNDFRPGSVLQGKLRCVLEAMVKENPHMAGWFADDVGSRAWFPGFEWRSWDRSSQDAYRQGAIALARTFREVADEHGLIFLVNGTWAAGELASHGGGYPDPSVHGNALADGGFVEHHDGQIGYFRKYACSSQWASQSAVTHGKAVNFAVTSTWEGLQEYARSGCFAYVNRQVTYDLARPWTGIPEPRAGIGAAN